MTYYRELDTLENIARKCQYRSKFRLIISKKRRLWWVISLYKKAPVAVQFTMLSRHVIGHQLTGKPVTAAHGSPAEKKRHAADRYKFSRCVMEC